MDGKVVIVTGANSGIGKSAAAQLGALGAKVVLVCRNEEKGRQAIAELEQKTGRQAFELVCADLSDLDQTRRAARDIAQRHPRIDVLINNAGVYLPTRHRTKDGFEAMFALNHLAPFVLTHALLPNLAAAGRARVVTTSSDGHRLGTIRFDDLQAERSFNGMRQYCSTKLANVLFTRELARRIAPRQMVAHAFHPGLVRTGFAQDERGLFQVLVKLSGPFLRGPDKAAKTATHLSASDDALKSSGDYWVDLERVRPARQARDDEAAARLWEISETLTGARWS
ncbi:MAG: SDR family oxidoreductase [Myxococcaceae bacterium]|nr:SDR family oxidoreductase [Myxococcaceae bacterium]